MEHMANMEEESRGDLEEQSRVGLQKLRLEDLAWSVDSVD